MERVFRCNHCGRFLSEKNFTRYPHVKQCKKCHKIEGSINKYHISDHRKEYMRKYMKENRALFVYNNAKYVAKKKGYTIKLTDNEKKKIRLYYKISKYLGDDWEVDHIIPISKGGLHHPDNLQILTREANRSKHNNERFVPGSLEYFKL